MLAMAACVSMLPIFASVGIARADGVGTGTTDATSPQTTTTATTTTTPFTNLAPTIVATPRMVLLSVRVTGDRVEVKVACTFAACKLTTTLTTLGHVHSGRTNSLSASGHEKHTRTLKIGSTGLKILPGRTGTLTLKLNATGLRLLESFHRIPASAMIALTNGQPVITLHRTLTVRQ